MNSEENVFMGPPSPYEPAKGGIGFELFRSLNKHKDKNVQLFIESGEVETYGSLLKKSISTAIYLQKKQLKEEDIICICSKNRPNFVVPFVAAKFIGVNYTSIEPTLPEDDMSYVLDFLEPKILFITEEIEEKIRTCMEKTKVKCDIVVLGNSNRYTRFSDILTANPPEKNGNFRPIIVEDLKETAVILLSSGTTGKPKGVCCNHYALLAQSVHAMYSYHGKGTVDWSNFQMKLDGVDSSTFLHYSPLYWISGMLLFLGFASIGGCCYIGSEFTAESAYEAIKKHKPHTVFLPPGHVSKLCLLMQNEKNFEVETFMTGGGLVNESHMHSLKSCFPKTKVLQAYGITESSGMVTGFSVLRAEDVEQQNANILSCGKACFNTKLKVVDPETEKVLPPDEEGELRIKHPYLMNGYYKIDSSSAFDADGWFKTGDLSSINKDGLVFIKDRLKDLLLYTLYNIRPSVIESVFYQHPAVLEAFVIGIPHPEDNEHPMGVVLLKDEFKGKITEEEILQFVNQRVPSDRYKIRAGVKILEDMLRTPTGKLKKLEMKRRIIGGEL